MRMNTLETDIEVGADGSIKLLSPLPGWMKPGRLHAWLTVAADAASGGKAKRPLPVATPEMVEERRQALAGLRAVGGLKEVIPDPAAWQRDIRQDVELPPRE